MHEFNAIFGDLTAILRPYADTLETKTDTGAELYVDTRHQQENNKPLFFGAVAVKKNYVTFHLMPVYVFPDLIDGISERLKKRMQGKSCFNFVHRDPALFQELAILVKAGYARYKARGFVS
jgi:hypothetical protein